MSAWPLVAAPFSERILTAGIGRLELTARSAGWIQPVRTRVVEDHVKQHPESTLMCLRDQLYKIIATAESGIDLKEVLYPVAVVAVEMTALPKDWAQPGRCEPRAWR
jgi:hypothetical protein